MVGGIMGAGDAVVGRVVMGDEFWGYGNFYSRMF